MEQKCKHPKFNVVWEGSPDELSVEGRMMWRGKCSCGKRVYEVYEPLDEVFEDLAYVNNFVEGPEEVTK